MRQMVEQNVVEVYVTALFEGSKSGKSVHIRDLFPSKKQKFRLAKPFFDHTVRFSI